MTRAKKVKTLNQYEGFKVPKFGWRVERISPNDVSVDEFRERFVKARKPVILTEFPRGSEWLGARELWRDEGYLRARAGSAEVYVEHSKDGAFGSGREKEAMSFARLLRRLADGEELYMTTQPDGADGVPPLLAPPLTHLLGDFPVRPSIAGGLVPHQINMWLGASPSPQGTSSGLHHDSHDNIYVLLAGSKRFTLFSPADATILATHGKLARVHPNGLINYEGELTRADGASAICVAEYRLAQAQRVLEIVEASISATDLDLERANANVDSALEAILDAQEGDEMDVDDADPSNFCKISIKDLRRAFPLPSGRPSDGIGKPLPSGNPSILGGATPALAELRSGEMLYLPASWFHEVTSYCDHELPFHLSMNYWFYPPSRFYPPSSDLYIDGTSEHTFKERQNAGQTKGK